MRKYNNHVKKIALFFLTITMVVSTLPISAVAVESYDFANFTEEDAVSFVEACDIDIPDGLLQNENFPSITLNLILQSYYSPNVPFCFNFNLTQNYAEAIRAAVRSFMNLGAVPAMASATAGYELQYNKVLNQDGEWDVASGGYYNLNWAYYNCYAFALNRCERSGFYSSYGQYQPGDMSGSDTFGYDTTVHDLADLVYDDLWAMGYNDIEISTVLPTIDETQELICVRVAYGWDYHFMRYDLATNAWYHKPGDTAVLKYNYTPSYDLLWYREYSKQYEWIYDPDDVDWGYYDGEIVFITYSKNQLNIDCDEEISRAQILSNKDIFYELNFAITSEYDIFLTSFYVFDYEIYDVNFNVVLSGTATNTGISVYLHPHLNSGKYYLRMSFEKNVHTTSRYIDISIEHRHEFDEYLVLDTTSHKQVCACGLTYIERHFVYADEIVDDRYAICQGCGQLVFLSIDDPTILATTTQVSVNGSYVLPSGIVVLVEEDIEAYLAGTLDFYFPDDITVTQ